MSADTKHPAEVLADSKRHERGLMWDALADEQLRRIPALEAERDEARRTVRMAHELGTAIAAERDQLRAEVDALREANSTFATAAILPDNKVIVDKAEIEALRDDCENARELARPVCEALNIPILHDAPRAIEALRADAERLDFIAKRARYDPKMDGQHVWWPTTFNNALRGPTLRDAIDAARKQQ